MAEAVDIFRALHVLFAISWAGAGFYFASVHVPLFAGKDPHYVAKFYAASTHNRYLAVTSAGTVLFGLLTIGIYPDAVVARNQMMLLGIGMLAGVIAFAVGAFGHTPLGRRLRPLARRVLDGDESANDEFQRLGMRDGVLGRISIGSVAVAMICMLLSRLFL